MDKSSAQYQWDLDVLYTSDNDPQIEKDLELSKKIVDEFSQKWSSRTDYLSQPETLKEALDEYEYMFTTGALGGDIEHYLSYRYYTDVNNSGLQALMNKVQDKELEMQTTLQFFELSLGKVTAENQEVFLSSDVLKEYAYYLEHIFTSAKYNLTPEAETVASSLSPLAYSNWIELMQKKISAESRTILKDGEEISATFATIMSTLNSTNKEERDRAAKVLNEMLEDHIGTAESEFNNVLKYRQVVDKLRGYPRPDASSHVHDGVTPDMIDPLIEAVTEGFDIAREFYEFKSKVVGVDALEYHERNIPVGEVKAEFDWDQTQEIVLEAFYGVDKEFGDLLTEMIKNRRVDVFPREGKIHGAYCWEGSKTAPVSILLNHGDDVGGVKTFAHEAGHAMNHIFFNRTQNGLNVGGSLFVAECCSMFMEDYATDIVKERLEGDIESQKVLAFNDMNEVISAVFRQTAGYNFETEVHKEFREKGYLSHGEIGEIFTKCMSAYMGSGVKQSKGSQNWWLYWSHFRRYFYLYSYVSGLLISRVLQKKFKEDPSFITTYKEFLAMGTSLSPKDQFAHMGIDVTDKNFWKEGVESCRQQLKDLKAMYGM